MLGLHDNLIRVQFFPIRPHLACLDQFCGICIIIIQMVSCRHFSVTRSKSIILIQSGLNNVGSKHFLADLMMLLLLLVFLLDLRERKREGDYSPSIKGSQFSFPLLSHLEMEFIIMMVLSVTYFYMLFYTFQFLLSCAQSNLIQSKCMACLDKV